MKLKILVLALMLCAAAAQSGQLWPASGGGSGGEGVDTPGSNGIEVHDNPIGTMPPAPDAGVVGIYPASDGEWYKQDSDDGAPVKMLTEDDGILDGTSDIATTGTISGKLLVQLFSLGYWTITPDPIDLETTYGGLVNFKSIGSDAGIILPVVPTWPTGRGHHLCIQHIDSDFDTVLVLAPGSGDEFLFGGTNLADDVAIRTTITGGHAGSDVCLVSQNFGGASNLGWVITDDDVSDWEAVP
jgi:hypothetical protein